MLSETLFRIPRAPGLQLLQRRGEHGARELTSWRLTLPAGGSQRFSQPGEEAVVVLQQGSGSFEVDAYQWTVGRTDVFRQRATALYLPPARRLRVHAYAPLDAIVVSTPAAEGGEPAVVRSEDITPAARGRGGYAREVHNVFVADSHARRLMVGETFNPPGHWSSFPPHKHDGRDGEPVLEEIYYYRIDPPHGFGQQMLYTATEQVTHTVRDGDAVLLPYGYHPVCAPPGYKLYYLWAMAGAERRLALHEDPAHRWIHDAP